MDIFISWHGKRSHAAAEALRGWLPLIVNAFKPWLSSADIDKGSRWRTALAAKLGSVTAGIFCLTPSNLTAPWLAYEAGAISRTPEETYVCTLLIDLQPSDVKDPLAQFQATKATKEDIHRLVKNLNMTLGEDSMDEALVNKAFEMWWPELEKQLKNLPPDGDAPAPQRSEREMLQELLEKVRSISQNLQPRTRSYHLTPTGELVASPPEETPEEANQLVAMRNYLKHQNLDPETIKATIAALRASGALPDLALLDRAAREAVRSVLGITAASTKKVATGGEAKTSTEPKPADPANSPDPGTAQKDKS